MSQAFVAGLTQLSSGLRSRTVSWWKSMCGICGAVWSDPDSSLSSEQLAAMRGRIVHRGPDDSGEYRDEHAALGFQRLSIIDLSGGHQPLSNEDGTVWTVFNGEIYNFPALRRRLEAKGHHLRLNG